VIVNEKTQVERVFEQLAWGAYVQPRRNPPAGRRPVAYIVVLINSERELGRFGVVDAAAAIENILLASWSKGIGSCWLASVKRERMVDILNIPAKYRIDSVVALGYPDETPLLEECAGEAVEYYLDDDDRLHVPKRLLKDITHVNTFGRPPAEQGFLNRRMSN
jgi:nitroreductase